MKLSIEKLCKYYGNSTGLDNVSLTLEDVSRVVFLGPSGSGKTTLLRILAGLIYPSSGKISINNKELLFNEKALHKYHQSISLVSQSYNLFPHLSALENLTLPLIKARGKSPTEAHKIAMDLFERFKVQDYAHKLPAQLSGGQNQRVALARALASGPHLILLDEPTSALDPEMTAEVLEAIRELQDFGVDFIMCTHEVNFAKHIADTIVFLDQHKIIDHGPPKTIFESSLPPLKNYFSRVLY